MPNPSLVTSKITVTHRLAKCAACNCSQFIIAKVIELNILPQSNVKFSVMALRHGNHSNSPHINPCLNSVTAFGEQHSLSSVKRLISWQKSRTCCTRSEFVFGQCQKTSKTLKKNEIWYYFVVSETKRSGHFCIYARNETKLKHFPYQSKTKGTKLGIWTFGRNKAKRKKFPGYSCSFVVLNNFSNGSSCGGGQWIKPIAFFQFWIEIG